MRATVHNYLEAMKQRREEEGEKGFSLIELIVVVVILGILAAVAIPIFLNIQAQARDSAGKTAAANAATQAAVQLAQSPTATPDLTNFNKGDVSNVTLVEYDEPDIDTICVSADVTGGTAATWFAGPGANAAGTACL